MRTSIALIALVLAACSSGAAPSNPPTSAPASGSFPPTASPSPSPSPSASIPADARILLADAGLFLDGGPFNVAVATSADEFADMWSNLGRQGDPPAVDFGQEVVLFFGMSGSSSCPERFEQLVVDEASAHVYAQWADQLPNQPCTDDLAPQGVLLAVARPLLPAEFRLSLREQPICPDCQPRTDEILVNLAG